MSLYFEVSNGSLNKKGEELCGDKVEIIRADGSVIMVLADGLGSGVKANILASLTSKIVATMLHAGAEVSDVVETMASTLPVCSERQVAYSTFTFLRIDPQGNARIVEYDNPPIVILRDGKKLTPASTETTYSGKVIRETNLKLKPDDYCIFFSDGAVHAGVGMLLNLGWQYENIVEYLESAYRKDLTAHSMQTLLLSACNSLYMDQPGDDTTVAVCKVRTPNIAMVMIGPPVEQKDDQPIVDRLLHFEGTKVVCGGTTSKIVSRISNRPLTPVLDYISADVPPIGSISGIDLVTEGVVTFGKALELMRRYEAGTVGRDNALNYKNDGAHLLAQTLINKCTGVHFVVGRALNPAHQNPDMPISLSIKLRLVEDMADCLRRLGKEVSVEYH